MKRRPTSSRCEARHAQTCKLKGCEGYGETSVRNLFAAIDARRKSRCDRLILGSASAMSARPRR